MELKRKRSSSLCSFSSRCSSSSPLRPGTFDFQFSSLSDNTYSHSSPCVSRTHKRLRNGRPSDEEVHARTLGMLYAGARREPEVVMVTVEEDGDETMQEEELTLAPVVGGDGKEARQRSLHSFWGRSCSTVIGSSSVPASVPVPVSTPSNVNGNRTPSCEACGQESMQGGDGQDAMQLDDAEQGPAMAAVCHMGGRGLRGMSGPRAVVLGM